MVTEYSLEMKWEAIPGDGKSLWVSSYPACPYLDNVFFELAEPSDNIQGLIRLCIEGAVGEAWAGVTVRLEVASPTLMKMYDGDNGSPFAVPISRRNLAQLLGQYQTALLSDDPLPPT